MTSLGSSSFSRDVAAPTSAAQQDAFANAAIGQQLFSSSPSTFEFAEFETPRGRFRSAAATSLGAAFLGGYPDWSKTDTMQLLYLDHLIPNSLNPRSVVIGEEMKATYESIKERGVHTAFEVCRIEGDPQKALMLSGHRRLALINKLSATMEPKIFLVPCTLDPRGVLTLQQVWEQLLSKNEGQVPPPPIDRAKGFVQYMKDCGLNQSQAAIRLGVPMSTLSRSLWLLKLPEELHSLVNEGALKETTAFELTKHQGGPRAQVELAQRIMRENLKLPQIRMIVKNSKPTGPELPAHHSRPEKSSQQIQARSTTDRDIYVGGDSRIHVRVVSDRTQLTAPELRRALLEAHGKLPIEMGVHHESHLAEPEQAKTELATKVDYVPVAALTFHAPEEVSQLFRKYFSSLLRNSPEESLSIPREIAQVLTEPLTQEQLLSYSISPCQVTRLYVSQFFRNEKQSFSPPVTPLQVALYWATKIEELSKMNPGQPLSLEFTTEARMDFNITGDRFTVKQAIGELTSRLKDLSNIVSTQLLFVMETKQKLNEFRSDPLQVRNRELFFTATELEGQGVNFGAKLSTFFFNWLQNQKDLGAGTKGSANGPLYNLYELQVYCLDSMVRLLDLCGGKTTGNHIGHSQLKHAQICYPNQVSSDPRSPAIDVYQNLLKSWELLGQMPQDITVR